jgi:hypothetical protein
MTNSRRSTLPYVESLTDFALVAVFALSASIRWRIDESSTLSVTIRAWMS